MFTKKGDIMRKLSVAIMMTTTLLAGSASAQDSAWYLGLKGGASIVQDRAFVQKDADAGAFKNDYKQPGFNVAGQVGYDFGAFRTEFELGYQQGSMTHFFNQGLPELGATDYFWDGRGKTKVTSFMLNGLFDIPTEGKTSGYIGGGIGLAHLKAKNYRVAKGANAFLNDGDTALAWQAIAGLRRELSDKADLTLEYRYFKATSGDFRTAGDVAVEGDYRSHSLMLGVSFNFGTKKEEPAAPPPPPPPPAPEPAPAPAPAPEPAPAPVPGPFMVFFEFDKAELTADAQQVLTQAAEAFKAGAPVQILVQGHTDRAGSDAYNLKLSERRAAAAKAFLERQGLSSDVLKTEAFGESQPLVETADGVREPQNRRVEIKVAQ